MDVIDHLEQAPALIDITRGFFNHRKKMLDELMFVTCLQHRDDVAHLTTRKAAK